MEYAEVPAAVLAELRRICAALPETREEQAWTGRRWRVRQRTFAHVLTVDSQSGPATIVTFRSPAPERDALIATGHPFFRSGGGRDVVGMVLDDSTDWLEVSELMAESYCVLAPKKLAALVGPPPG